MLIRRHSTLDDTDVLGEVPVTAASDAEVASCTCPELCIRDHEHE